MDLLTRRPRPPPRWTRTGPGVCRREAGAPQSRGPGAVCRLVARDSETAAEVPLRSEGRTRGGEGAGRASSVSAGGRECFALFGPSTGGTRPTHARKGWPLSPGPPCRAGPACRRRAGVPGVALEIACGRLGQGGR